MSDFGQYRVLKQIGKGGFGNIYQVEHTLLEEKACLKENINATADDAELLRLEAKVLWRLDEHHSIPSAKDFFKTGKNKFALVMSYIEGDTLEEAVEKNSRLHPEDASWVTERVLGALYYCHCNGVIHSDVKPQNVFVEPAKHDIKLVDFGLSVYKPDSSTLPMGYTPAYAAPELKAHKPPIPETDLYGAGLVMLYALGGDIAKMSLPADTPKELMDYCDKLLRFDPRERPNWDKENPIERLSDIRQKLFGRRHVY